MERVHDDKYFISTTTPSERILQELQTKNIIVTSGGSPLGIVRHNDGGQKDFSFTYIFANRKDAIGAFDESVLPK
jgi:hypothetical protein